MPNESADYNVERNRFAVAFSFSSVFAFFSSSLALFAWVHLSVVCSS